MKIIIITVIVLTIFSFAYPAAMALTTPMDVLPQQSSQTPSDEPDSSTQPQDDTASEDSSASSSQTGGDAQAAVKPDESIMIKVLKSDGNVYDMTMRDYLISVVAAEMPVSFEPEALKAQAVAARTYTLYNMLVSPSHENADVCTDYACCKAYIEIDELKTQWGGKYEEYIKKIDDAVSSTDGKYMSYNNEIVLAVFHSSSAGRTENAEEVWNTGKPYLVSVDSPETADIVPNFKTTVTVTHKEFVDTVKAAYPEAYFGDDITAWVGETVNTPSGRVDHITIGGIDIEGTKLRDMFDLRSAYFSLDLNSLDATFTVTGYGHGVGMSQYGANVLALEGKNYEEILKWYYTGVELRDDAELFE